MNKLKAFFIMCIIILASFMVLTTNTSGKDYFTDDMESGVNGWTYDGLWNQTTNRYHSASTSWYYGNQTGFNYSTSNRNMGNLTSPEINLTSAKYATLSFWTWYETEGVIDCDRMVVKISVNNTPWQELYQIKPINPTDWYQEKFDLFKYLGNNIRIRFYFDTMDATANNFEGWYIDDVNVSTEDHDIAVTNLQAPNWLKPDNSTYVNATIWNIGLVNESYIQINFTVNGTLNKSIQINLTSGNSTNVSFFWIPLGIGNYTVGIEAQPVLFENITENNQQNKIIVVAIGPKPGKIALISDMVQLNSIITILNTLKPTYDNYNNNNVNFYTENLSLLFEYEIVIYCTNEYGITFKEYNILEAYLQAGGNLIITGFDSLSLYSFLVDLIRSSSCGDGPFTGNVIIQNGNHPITDGAYGTFPLGSIYTPVESDHDQAIANTSAGAISIASISTNYDKIICTELPSGGRVIYWNGDGAKDWPQEVNFSNMLKNMISWIMDWIKPVADAGPDRIVDEDTIVIFDGSKSTDNVEIINFTWTFYDIYYKKNITLYGNKPSNIFYQPGNYSITLNVSDAKDNWDNDTVWYNVSDITKPRFVSDITPKSTTTGESVIFTINVTDNVGVDKVFVEYWYGTDTHQNLSMSGTKIYTKNIIISDTLNILHYFFSGNDTSNNWNKTEVNNVIISDNDIPYFGEDNTPTIGTTGDEFIFSIEVNDNIAINKVYVEYWYGAGSHQNVSMPGLDHIYNKQITIPHKLDTLQYFFIANDTSNNWNYTSIKNVLIKDNDMPTFNLDNTPTKGTTGDSFTFSINVTDNIDISTVWVEYWFGDEEHINNSMSISSKAYTKKITIPHKLDTLNYLFRTNDTSNNWNHTLIKNVPISDNDMPVIIDGSGNFNTTTGESFTVYVNFSDNIGITNCNIYYKKVGTTSWENKAMIELTEGKFSIDNMGMDIDTTYNDIDYVYYIIAKDSAKNFKNYGNEDSPFTITVIDNDKPIANAGSDWYIQISEWATFDGSNSTDNIGIENYTWTFTYNDENIILYGEVTSFLFIKPDIYEVILTVKDMAGNSDSDILLVTVSEVEIDTEPPVANAGPDQKVEKSIKVTFDGSTSTDNDDISNYTWAFNYDNEEKRLYGETASFVFNIVGNYIVTLTVYDFATLPNSDSDTLWVNVTEVDSDGDGIPDYWEDDHGLDKNQNDANEDPDKDGRDNLQEYKDETDPNKANDFDNDGLPDDWEMQYFDSYTLYGANDDPDKDGKTNKEEYDAETDPTNKAVEEEEETPFDLGTGISYLLFIIIIVIIIIIIVGLALRKHKREEVEEEEKEEEEEE